MDSDQPIPTDASTVHRGPDGHSGDAPSQPPAEASDAEQMAEAQTVIRGSSREGSGNRSDEGDRRTPAAVAKVLLGQRLNHFLLEELIGGGGMGAVFRAHDEQLDRTVAIKVIPFVGDDADLQRRFRNEAQSAARLDHPHIARVFDVGSQDSWHYIVFEYIRGENVRDQVAASGVLSIDDAVFYTCQLAEAIQHSSDRGIVHRDIKPSNVLICEDDQVKLVDMGLARSENLEITDDMTASGVTLGTFDYISPEQARNPRDADVRSDIYSLGCTLYYMLTGRPPFPGGTMLQKLLSHGNAPPPDARELRPDVSEDLMAVIRKMLAKSPGDRYQYAGDLIADLREVAVREGLTRTEAVASVAAPPPNRLLKSLERHAPWMVAAALLIISAGWLHLMSAMTRDDFSITVPTTATVAHSRPRSTSRSTDAAPPIPAQNAGGQSPAAERSAAVAPEVETGEADSQAEDATTDSAAQPPSLQDIDIPTQLGGAPDEPIFYPEPDGGDFFTLPRGFDQRQPDRAATAGSESLDPETIRTIQVIGTERAVDEVSPGEGVAVTRTLAEALHLAEQHEIDHLEITAPVIHSGAVEIPRDGLRITSPLDGGSTIVFESTDTLAMERSRMMTIGPHRIAMENLHLVWNVSNDEIDGGSLFLINDNRLVQLTDCTITVENSSRRDEVYAFDIITSPDSIDQSRRDEVISDDGSLPLVAIDLDDVIIRGEMTMLHMDFAAELQLDWDNGLLAVSRRMIDTAGVMRRPPLNAAPIQLRFDQLVAHAPRGLVRMRLGVSGPYPVEIDREANNCVFVVDRGVPHVEILGLAELERETPLLQLRGVGNTYDAEPTLVDPVLALSRRGGETEQTRLNDLLSDPPSWTEEKSPRWTVRWSLGALPDRPPSELRPADFRQDGTGLSGFDENTLPEPPAKPRLRGRSPAEAEEAEESPTHQEGPGVSKV